ncbi:MAG: hypothetical protein J07HQW2_00190 [Haloquadratum walsbyi J07HQW2]|uniref:Uncharacterized protein n=1 Tax=Haloquadratum walsbyi J07HQW2 TaxID=1238425 RepID=U1PND3_9EURY|nr:MAG: hypothetical protein J07HQW2_00190 [Haloquadratum walsbyi J07HQW2]
MMVLTEIPWSLIEKIPYFFLPVVAPAGGLMLQYLAHKYVCGRIEADMIARIVRMTACGVGLLSTAVLYTVILNLLIFSG